MKNIKFLGLFLLATALLLTSCKKDKQYTITVNSNNVEWGTVTGGGTYAENASATLTATAKEGYKFVSWQDGNTDNPRTVTVTKDETYTATFEATTPAPAEGITIILGDETWSSPQFYVDEDYLASLGVLTVWIQKTSAEYPRLMGYLGDHIGTFTNFDFSVLMYMGSADDCDEYGNPNWQPINSTAPSATTTITAIDFNTHTISATYTGTLQHLATGETKSLNIVFNNAQWIPSDVYAKNISIKKF